MSAARGRKRRKTQKKNEELKEEVKLFPTWEEWKVATKAGFQSNGATIAPDSIYLVRIANGDNRYPPLPADLHDYRYWVGGDEEDRRLADHEFFEFMLDIIEERMWWVLHPFARRRALKYYEAVRLLGYRYFNYKGEKE